MAKGDPMTVPPRASSWLRWVIPFALLITLIGSQLLISREPRPQRVAYSTFYELVDHGKVAHVLLSGQTASGELKQREELEGNRPTKSFDTTLPLQEDEGLFPLLRREKVAVDVETSHPSVWTQLAFTLLPWALILAGWFWLSRRARSAFTATGPLSNLLKGPVRRFERKDNVRVRFDDVAGLGSAKRDLMEVVDFLRDPSTLPQARRQAPTRRSPRGPARHRKDAPRARRRGRGRRAVLLRERLGVHPALRGRRRVASARALRRGKEGRAVDRLHRRD